MEKKNKQGNYLPGLPWVVTRWVNLLAHFKVYTEAVTGFSPIYHPDSLNNTLPSPSCTLESGSHCGSSGRECTFQGQARGEEPATPGSSSQVSQQSGPLSDLPQQHPYLYLLNLAAKCQSSSNLRCNNMLKRAEPLSMGVSWLKARAPPPLGFTW